MVVWLLAGKPVDLFRELTILLLSFKNYQNLNILGKPCAHKKAFRARKVIATFKIPSPGHTLEFQK